MADKVKQSLHPEVVVYIFRHGHAASAENGEEDDFNRVLSREGSNQAYQLGSVIAAANIVFDQTICSAAPRAQDTARIARRRFYTERWYDGKNWELYSPMSVADNKAMWAATNRLAAKADLGIIPSPMSYAAFKQEDVTGSLERFMDEARSLILALSGIGEARRIAIFDHAVLGNAVAEALFPQHARALEAIELAPCDGIRITATSCQHLPLMT